MRNSYFSMGVLHVKCQILTHFLWRHFSARSSLYCFIWKGIQRGVYKKILNFWFLWWIDYDHISVLYKFQIDILLRPPTNSREIKYRNMGICLLHAKRDTSKMTFFNDFMRNNNFGIGVLHVKVKYWRFLCDINSLLAQVFIVSMAQFLWYDCTFKKQPLLGCLCAGLFSGVISVSQTILMTPE